MPFKRADLFRGSPHNTKPIVTRVSPGINGNDPYWLSGFVNKRTAVTIIGTAAEVEFNDGVSFALQSTTSVKFPRSINQEYLMNPVGISDFDADRDT